MEKHRLSNIDREHIVGTKTTAVCSLCGPVTVYQAGSYKGTVYFECGQARNIRNRKRYSINAQPFHDRVYKWRETKPEAWSLAYKKSHHKMRYKLSEEDFQKKMREQNGVCALCGKYPSEKKALGVDHDHKCCPANDNRTACGKCNRGLLCHNCNVTLGYIESSLASELLTSISGPIADYLNKWKAAHEAEKAQAASAI